MGSYTLPSQSPVHRIRLYCTYCSSWLEESFLIATATLVLAFEKRSLPVVAGVMGNPRALVPATVVPRRNAEDTAGMYVSHGRRCTSTALDGCTDHCTSALRPPVIAVWSQHTARP
jgi:hypothetical protein